MNSYANIYIYIIIKANNYLHNSQQHKAKTISTTHQCLGWKPAGRKSCLSMPPTPKCYMHLLVPIPYSLADNKQ